jgi:hypothetical protein
VAGGYPAAASQKRDLDEAWQHDLGDDGIVDTSLFNPGLIVVATVPSPSIFSPKSLP